MNQNTQHSAAWVTFTYLSFAASAFMVGIDSAAIAAVVAVVTIPGPGVTVPVEEPVSFRGGAAAPSTD